MSTFWNVLLKKLNPRAIQCIRCFDSFNIRVAIGPKLPTGALRNSSELVLGIPSFSSQFTTETHQKYAMINKQQRYKPSSIHHSGFTR
jgi:hypothetical protein